MSKPLSKIVFLGSLDHGKSTLIGRLAYDTQALSDEKLLEARNASGGGTGKPDLAFFTDQLKEEREGGLTMDTAQVLLRTARRDFALIDVPGHLELIKNMISGASQADFAVLVIDAAEGVREQTRRHLFLMNFLGIKDFVLVLSKMDLAGYEKKAFDALVGQWSQVLSAYDLKPQEIIPVSSKDDVNITRRAAFTKWYRGATLLQALSRLKTGSYELGAARFPVQDVYTVGKKELAVGCVASGGLRIGQSVVIYPSGLSAFVKKIHEYGKKEKKKAVCSENIGLELAKGAPALKRGDVVCQADKQAEPVSRLTLPFFWMSSTPLQKNSVLKIRCSTQEVSATVSAIRNRINTSTLEILETASQVLCANEACELELLLDRPLVVEDARTAPDLARVLSENDEEISGFGMIKKEARRQSAHS